MCRCPSAEATHAESAFGRNMVRNAPSNAAKGCIRSTARPCDRIVTGPPASRRNARSGCILPAGERTPDRETVRRFIGRTISSYEMDLRREGPDAAGKNFVRGKPLPNAALDVVEIDSTSLDLMVELKPGDYGFNPKLAAGKKPRKQTARPTLTVAIDVATRMVYGFHIGLAAPSWACTMDCLLHGMRPKRLEGTARGATWPVEGIPVELRTDGGSEFKGLDTKDIFAKLEMTVTRCAPGKAKDKPYVERFIGTVNRNFVATLPGRTFANPKERGHTRRRSTPCSRSTRCASASSSGSSTTTTTSGTGD